MRIFVSKLFERQFHKLTRTVQKEAEKRDVLFRANPFDSRLKTHKLHGRQKAEWAYTVTHSYRVTFLFLEDGTVLYTGIGTHDELY